MEATPLMPPILCRSALRPDSHLDKALTEKGVLQLLFDLRFLTDALSAGKPANTSASEEAVMRGGNAEVAALREAFEEIEAQLQVGSKHMPLGESEGS